MGKGITSKRIFAKASTSGGGGSVGTLQQVTDTGNTTTDAITVNQLNVLGADNLSTTKYFSFLSANGDTVSYLTKGGQMWLGEDGPTGTPQGNIAIGYGSGLNYQTTGQQHITLFGAHSGRDVTTGTSLTAVGANSGLQITIGTDNTSVGRDAMFNITTGSYNTLLGSNTGNGLSTTSDHNTIVGAFGMDDATPQALSNNTGIGYGVLNRTRGSFNTAIGNLSGIPYTWATPQAYNYTISLGPAVTSGSNQMNIGGIGSGIRVAINNVYFNGRFDQVVGLSAITLQNVSVTPTAFTGGIFGSAVTDGSATASPLTIASSQSTGTGTSGSVFIAGAPAGSTGSVSNALVNTMEFTGENDVKYSQKSINTTAGDTSTQNALNGRFRKDTSGTTFTLTNKFITANSIIMLTPANASIDTTATNWTVSAGSGSAVITFNLAPTSNFDMNFFITN